MVECEVDHDSPFSRSSPVTGFPCSNHPLVSPGSGGIEWVEKNEAFLSVVLVEDKVLSKTVHGYFFYVLF